MWRHPYPTIAKQEHIAEAESIGQWRDQSRRDIGRVLRILTLLDARPEFINATPSLCQQAKRRVAERVLR
jgi:hypothetical protein